MTINWDTAEKIDVPAGSFIGWGSQPGQKVIAKVLAYNPAGGEDFNKNVCPLMSVELIEPTYSVNKAGQQTPYNVGDLVNLTCGAYNLKANVLAANPAPGDLMRIELVALEDTAKGGTVKKFDVKIIHGGAAQAQLAQQQAPAQQQTYQPPVQQQAPAGVAKPDNFSQEQWDGMDAATKEAIAAMNAPK